MTTARQAPPTLLCVHPHPDDESIACGGVLARAADAGVRTVVVTCTGGEEGENLAGIDLGTDDLVVHRRRELAAALAILGVQRHHELGYRDSGMAGTSSNEHPDSFARADVEVAAARLAAIIRSERPQVVVSDDAQGTYGHPDHVQAHRVTVRAVELAADPHAPVAGPVWRVSKRYSHTLGKGRLLAGHRALLAAGLPSPFGDAVVDRVEELPLGTPDEQVTTEVDVGAWLERKRAAMAAHRSQIGPDSFFLNTPEELASSMFATEQFVLEDGRPGGDGLPENDLFAGVAPAPVSAVTPSPASFRAAMGRFLTGVAIMTTEVDGAPHGMTANAVSSVSLTPPLVLVCVERTAHMADAVAAAGVFALSFLAEDQAAISDRFADPSRGQGEVEFDGVAFGTAVTGARVLAGATGFVDCSVDSITVAGDHLIVVGEVVAVGTGGEEAAPLAYFQGGYGRYRAAIDVDAT
ncbi:MAG: N-acetyl-1-D-myo-inositol-2-amino-2-deoxy-alpha-D-glucopyranoside deacetylase [Nitriliruptoraceae bacterium]